MNDRSHTNDMERLGGRGGATLAGFLIGAVCGAGLALLLAPSTGGVTRRKLGETVRKLGSRASEVVGRVRDNGPGGESPSAGSRAGESYRSGGRREPLGGGRSQQPGTQGTES